MSTVAALSTFYPEARNIADPKCRRKQIIRLIGKMPTLAAYAYRHRLGMPYIYPDPELGYTKNYMNMLWKRAEPKYAANPVLSRALEVLFILHADHEQNCSTSAMRAVGSSGADPYATAAAAIAALSGPLHGGPTKRCCACWTRSVQGQTSRLHRPGEGWQAQADGFRPSGLQELRSARAHHQAGGRGSVRGHRPQPEDRYGHRLERIALSDEYFIKRKLYPNVDFYSGIIYQAMGFKPSSSPCCSASRARWAGWRSGRKC